MTMHKKTSFVLALLFLAFSIQAQQGKGAEQIRRYIDSKTPVKTDSAFHGFFGNFKFGDVNYLMPLYESLGWEERSKKERGEKNYYDIVSQEFASVGDYRMVDIYGTKNYDTLANDARKFIRQEVAQIKNIQSINAALYVAGRALDAQVVMINEAHDKPLHRAFTYSLLEQLYQQGFRYLAMEMLSNFGTPSLKEINNKTGFYAQEPVAGELIRKALSLGYTLVPYEDTALHGHTGLQRDSAQAANIYRILQKDPKAKILVHAGYGHISEIKLGEDLIPMGMAFKKLSGIDPLTVNQTNFTEGSTGDYGRVFYTELMQKIKIDEPVVLLKGKNPYSLIDQEGYDIFVVHPPVIYKNNRPTWLSFDGARKEVSVSPQEKNLFLVQAYYEDEYNKHPLETLIPADQTYIASDYGYYSLYLKPGKYKLVFRDVGYNNLNVRDRTVE
ncbi:MAG: hypothetical protein DI535_24280 [Citrobacter freundii]|nr:MAG: hypothetical protein DI535_24280 [Citrobacter freundii]